MKLLFYLVIVAMATSCGVQKKALKTQNALLQEQVAMKQQQIEQQKAEQLIQQQQMEQQQMEQQDQNTTFKQPTRDLRENEPCMDLALAEEENLRVFGSAISPIEKIARNEALRDARNQFATRLQVAVDGAALDYAQNTTENVKKSASELGEVIMTQYVSQIIKNTKPIKWSVYDLSDGSIEVYVCLEMVDGLDEVKKGLGNALSRNAIIGIQHDRERFIDKTLKGLENFKKQQNIIK